ncbi:MAG: hypothetical protein WA160_17090 [Pseudobdellovibrio sp.]
MYLFQTLSKPALDDLNTQLSDFGLQPEDWTLTLESDKKIKIKNKQEASFYFFGSIENQKGKSYWKNIQLANL